MLGLGTNITRMLRKIGFLPQLPDPWEISIGDGQLDVISAPAVETPVVSPGDSQIIIE